MNRLRAFWRRLLCLRYGHDHYTLQAFMAPTTQLACNRCPWKREIPVTLTEVGIVTTEVVFNEEKGQSEFRAWEGGRNVLNIAYARGQLIKQGQAMLNLAAKLGRMRPEKKPEAA